MSKTNDKLEELTSNILLSHDMYKIPVDVISIAKANDIKVFEASLNKKISGAIRYNSSTNKFEILINKDDAKVRQRFTIAHEIGHFFLHQEMLKSDEIHIDIMYRMTNEQEKEVDYFAGALLMNKTLLEKAYKDGHSITELAELFDVSVSAMTVRLDVLGLL